MKKIISSSLTIIIIFALLLELPANAIQYKNYRPMFGYTCMTVNGITWAVKGYSSGFVGIIDVDESVLQDGILVVPERITLADGKTEASLNSLRLHGDSNYIQKCNRIVVPSSVWHLELYDFDENITIELTRNMHIGDIRVGFSASSGMTGNPWRYIDFVFSEDSRYTTDDNFVYELTPVGSGYEKTVVGYLGGEICNIPDDVVGIDEGAFNGLKFLKEVYCGEKTHFIGEEAFLRCEELEKIDLNNVGVISDYAFACCTSLKKLDLKKVRTIGSFSFESCSSLKKLYIPKTVTRIDSNAFDGCSGIKRIEFQKRRKDIILDSECFAYLGNLKKVIFNGKVKQLDNSVFRGCTALKQVEFKRKGLEKLGKKVFGENKSLRKITISNTKKAPTIETTTFYKAKTGIKFYVRNKTVAKKLWKNLNKAGYKTAKIYVKGKRYYL